VAYLHTDEHFKISNFMFNSNALKYKPFSLTNTLIKHTTERVHTDEVYQPLVKYKY